MSKRRSSTSSKAKSLSSHNSVVLVAPAVLAAPVDVEAAAVTVAQTAANTSESNRSVSSLQQTCRLFSFLLGRFQQTRRGVSIADRAEELEFSNPNPRPGRRIDSTPADRLV
jgi:hypothetical protein